MTSLEFIEKEIENIKEFLSDSVDVIGKNTKDSDFWEQRLNHLQQIKSELEAWEIVKNKSVDMLIFMLYYDNLEEYNNYIKSLEGECDYEKCLLTQEEANSIKKALEVHSNEYFKNK